MKVDVVIPFHPKDIDTLPWCIEGIRSNLPASRVLVIGSAASRPLLKKYDVEFVDEDAVIPGLKLSSHSGKRWGWYFQQILKLGIADHVTTDHYLAVDADTVFLRTTPLFSASGKPLYATSESIDHHKPYFEGFERLMGFQAEREYSFVVHHMLFNKQRVIEMREMFTGGPPWYAAIIDRMNQGLPFSEYETYGHYLKHKYPDDFELRQLRWSDIWILPTRRLIGRLATCYDFCAFHAHFREKPLGRLQRAAIRFKIERRIVRHRLRSCLKR